MMAYYIKGANGKLFEPGRKKRNYVDAGGKNKERKGK